MMCKAAFPFPCFLLWNKRLQSHTILDSPVNKKFNLIILFEICSTRRLGSVDEVKLGQWPKICLFRCCLSYSFKHTSGTLHAQCWTFIPNPFSFETMCVPVFVGQTQIQALHSEWFMIRPIITLDVLPLHNPICLSHRCIWPVPPCLCQVLRRTWLSHSSVSTAQSYWGWTETGWPETCLSKRDKGLFHDYRERLKLLWAYITSQEVA